jgi:hypothetical protein
MLEVVVSSWDGFAANGGIGIAFKLKSQMPMLVDKACKIMVQKLRTPFQTEWQKLLIGGNPTMLFVGLAEGDHANRYYQCRQIRRPDFMSI